MEREKSYVEELEIKKQFIALIDILGYEQHLNRQNYPEAFLGTMYNIVTNTKRGIKVMDNFKGEPTNVKLKVFSDNFFLCSESNWEGLLFFVMTLHTNLLMNGIFVRGSLCYGDLCFNDEFVYGKGIINAHNVESNIAIYPRIIVDESFIHGAVETTKRQNGTADDAIRIFNMYFSNDECDSFRHLDYLKAERTYALRDGYDIENILTRHRELIIENLKKYKNNLKILQKYQWSKNYHNKFCTSYDYSSHMITAS